MKMTVRLLLLVLAAVMLLTGCSTEGEIETTSPPETEPLYPYDFTSEEFFYIRNYLDYIPVAPCLGVTSSGTYFELPSYDVFRVMQGGCCDGTYAYFILEGDTTFDGVATKGHMIFKVDMATWEIVDQSEPLQLDHGNGMCYNPKLNSLIVANCNDVITTDDEDHSKMITFVDPDTLEITGTKFLSLAINSIDYNAKRDEYVVGIKSNSASFAVLNSDFVELGYYEGHQVGLGSQDVDCDDNYIYVGNSGVSTRPGMEVVKIYNWDGEYMGIFRVDNVSEQEAIFNYNGKYYITFYTGAGGRVYELKLDFSLLADAK